MEQTKLDALLARLTPEAIKVAKMPRTKTPKPSDFLQELETSGPEPFDARGPEPF